MALGTVTSGTLSTTVGAGVEDLATTTVAGIYVCQWNLTNLAKSDVLRCLVKNRVLTGDTAEISFEGIYANDLLSSCIIQSPPILSMFSLTMSLNHSAGTSRSVPWILVRVAEYA